MRLLPHEGTPSDHDPGRNERTGRTPLEVPVQLRIRDVSHGGVTKNVGGGGLFVATIRPFAVGDHVTVILTIREDPEPVEALAEVRWVRSFQELDDRPAGLGLRLIDTPLRTAILTWELRLARPLSRR